MRFGFDPAQPDVMEAALLKHPAESGLTDVEATAVGMKVSSDGALSSPDGRDPWVRTV